MKALHRLGYGAVGIGKSEMAMPLLDALAEYTLNNPNPHVLAANLLNRGKDELFNGLIHDTYLITQDETPPVGVIGLIGPSVQSKVNDPDAKFSDNNAQVIQRSLLELRGKCALTVLLYQGTTEEAKVAAQYCAQLHRQNNALPRLDVILCLSEEAEPPATAVQVPGVPTLIFNIGHKGRYVGVVGAFRNATGYDLKYQLVAIGPEYETPDGQEAANPIMGLMTSYAKEVKAGQYIIRYRTSPHPVQVAFPQARYVGSDRCAGCHASAHEKWEKSLHAKAYETLVQEKHPPHREWDGECVACHVVGFTHPTGYSEALRVKLGNDGLRGANQEDKISAEARKVERLLPQLQHVGCESCHGPCSEHVQNPLNPAIHAVINPWKGKDGETEQEHARRMLKIDLFCQTCHDVDNDVHWDFQKKWPKIIHMTPKTDAANQVEPAPKPARSCAEGHTSPGRASHSWRLAGCTQGRQYRGSGSAWRIPPRPDRAR
jgi:hypothetical protein